MKPRQSRRPHTKDPTAQRQHEAGHVGEHRRVRPNRALSPQQPTHLQQVAGCLLVDIGVCEGFLTVARWQGSTDDYWPGWAETRSSRWFGSR